MGNFNILLNMSTSLSRMYTLKYNIKYALESEGILTEAEKKQIRQAQHISKLISYSFWVYLPVDVGLSMYVLFRKVKPSAAEGVIHRNLRSSTIMTKVPVLAAFW